MPSFLDKAKNNQEEGREKDPAAPSGDQEPDWDNPDSWGGDGNPEGDSASGNDGDSASGNRDQEHGDDGASSRSTAPKSPRRPPRRPGRPRGPQREMLSVRILPSHNRQLTVAIEQTNHNVQTLVDQALEALFRKLKVEDPGPEQVEDIA